LKWLNRDRLTIYPLIFLIFYAIVAIVLIATAVISGHGMADFWGRPLGADFSHYWLASSMVLAGDPAGVFNFPGFLAAEKAFFGVHYPVPWFYPPTFLLIVSPLALLPYLPSLVLWLGLTLSGYLLVLRRIAPHPSTIWLALAFPGTFENFFHGQNGFLSAALLGSGLLLLDSYPVTGGFLLGLLSYKPQLAILVPVALIAGRRWQALVAMLIGALMLISASFWFLGKEVWIAFFHNSSLPLQLLKDGSLPVAKMVTVFSAILLFGGGLRLAVIIQAGLMVGVASGIIWIWRRETSLATRAAALVVGILLFTPYAFAYDLAILALALAWLGWEGFTRGWLPHEPEILCLGWLMPFIAPVLGIIKFQLAPLILVALFVLVIKKCKMNWMQPPWQIPIRREIHE
jgi:alpha-1,2-mannosyltransferase